MSSFSELADVLEQQSHLIDRLLELERAEREAIAARDSVRMVESAAEKEQLARQLSALEARRQQVAGDIVGSLPEETEPNGSHLRRTPAVRELLAARPSTEASRVDEIAARLADRLARLQGVNGQNRQLVLSALSLVNNALDYLNPSAMDAAPYGPPDSAARRLFPSANTKALIDRRI